MMLKNRHVTELAEELDILYMEGLVARLDSMAENHTLKTFGAATKEKLNNSEIIYRKLIQTFLIQIWRTRHPTRNQLSHG